MCSPSWDLSIHKRILLTRLALPDRSVDTCTSLASHKRAVLLIIDALRFDFIAEHPPEPVSLFHNSILTLPCKLTAARLNRSFIFNTYSDPLTTALQRLKGIATWSLPTFSDAGENFVGSSIYEDSIIHQLNAAGRKVCADFFFPDTIQRKDCSRQR